MLLVTSSVKELVRIYSQRETREGEGMSGAVMSASRSERIALRDEEDEPSLVFFSGGGGLIFGALACDDLRDLAITIRN